MQSDLTDTAEQRFAYWLKRLREQHDPRLSQVALAEMVGLDPTALTKIEKGNRSIRLNEAYALAEALGRTVSSMLLEPGPDAREELIRAEDELRSVDRVLEYQQRHRTEVERLVINLRRVVAEQEADPDVPRSVKVAGEILRRMPVDHDLFETSASKDKA